MTVSTQDSYVTFVGNDATTVFPYAFEIPTGADDIYLWSELTGSVLLDPADYSISGLDDPAGGNVTYPLVGSPISTDYTLTISRVVPAVQATDISSQANFYPQVIEDALDYLTFLYQQLAFASQRTVTLAIGDPTSVADYLAAAQAAAATAEAAAASVNTSFVFITSGTVVNAATLDIVISPYISLYRAIKFVLTGFRPTINSTNLWMRTSADGGVSYDVAGYRHAKSVLASADVAVSSVQSNSDAQILLGSALSNSTTEGYDGEITGYNLNDAAKLKQFLISGVYLNLNLTPGNTIVNGMGARNAAAIVNAVQFMFSSGNISQGNWAIFGLK